MTWRGPLHTAALTTLARASGYLAVAILALGPSPHRRLGTSSPAAPASAPTGPGPCSPRRSLPRRSGHRPPPCSGTSADLLVTVSNPNPGPVTLVSVAQGGGVAVGAPPAPTTPSTPGLSGNSGVSLPTASALSIPVAGGRHRHRPPGRRGLDVHRVGPGCQGASFQIPVTVVVQQ